MPNARNRDPHRQPWGWGLTLILSGAIFLGYAGSQMVVLVPAAAAMAGLGVRGLRAVEFLMTGAVLGPAMFVGCPIMLVLCALAAWARRSMDVVDYLALHRVRAAVWSGWSVVAILACVGTGVLNHFLGRPPPEFIEKVYSTAGYLPWFWTSIVICAPLAEEILFRGFMFAGLAASRLGNAGAVVVTSLLFGTVHMGQYGWVELADVTFLGFLFGFARVRTGSLLVPLAMHVATNLTALTLHELSR